MTEPDHTKTRANNETKTHESRDRASVQRCCELLLALDAAGALTARTAARLAAQVLGNRVRPRQKNILKPSAKVG